MSRLQDAILRGTRAAQPAVADVGPGVLYYVTDEQVTERVADDGLSWEDYSDAGSAPTAITQLTGDVTAGPGPGSVAATIANLAVTTGKIAADAVTYAKIQNVSAASRVLGRGSAAGAGDVEELSFGTGLSVSGTTINNTVTDTGINQLTGDVTAGPGNGSQAATLANTAVTPASYTHASITVDAKGRLTAASNGTLAKQKLSFTIDGGGSAISSTGLQKYFSCAFTGTITAVRLLGDQSGSCVLDIWKDTWANRPPTNADSIVASAKPTLSSAQFYEDTTLTGWTTSVTAGDLLGVEIESISTLTWLVMELFLQPT